LGSVFAHIKEKCGKKHGDHWAKGVTVNLEIEGASRLNKPTEHKDYLKLQSFIFVFLI
jgi:hypothetical protein